MTTLCIDELAGKLKQCWGWPAGADHVPPGRLKLQPGDTVFGQTALTAPSIGLREAVKTSSPCLPLSLYTSWQGLAINGIMYGQTE